MKSKLHQFTYFLLIFSLILIIYGYLCRLIGFNFFWESQSIGFELLLIAILGFLVNRIQVKKSQNKEIISEKIGIGLLCFVLMVQIIVISIIPRTDAYAEAKIFLANDAELKTEIGNIYGFTLIPRGSIQATSTSKGTHSNSVIYLTAKGDKKFKDIVLYLEKSDKDSLWKVQDIEYE
jgi:hypothetical protein